MLSFIKSSLQSATKTGAKADANKECTSTLTNISANGVDLSMAELLYYQNKTALIDLSAKKNIHGRMSGNYLSRSKGRGMEFDEVRHYQTGDDIRAIDWRVTARTGKTHTKLFREEIERPVLITTDLTSSMHFGSKLLFKSVQASHIAALVAWHAKLRGDRLGGIIFNQNKHLELKPRSRKEGVLHYLHALTKIHAEHNQVLTTNTSEQSKTDIFMANCARLRQLAKPGSLVYLITDGHFLDEHTDTGTADKDIADRQSITTNSDIINTDNTDKNINVKTNSNALQIKKILHHLGQISQHCELVICLVSDPLEQQLPTVKTRLNVVLTDGYQRQQFSLGDKRTALEYQQQALSLIDARQQKLIEVGARVINFDAGQTLEAQMTFGSKIASNSKPVNGASS